MSGILYKLLEWDIGKDPVEYSQQIRPLIEKERLRQEELTEKGITIGEKEKKIVLFCFSGNWLIASCVCFWYCTKTLQEGEVTWKPQERKKLSRYHSAVSDPITAVFKQSILHCCAEGFHRTIYSLTKNAFSEKHYWTVVVFKEEKKSCKKEILLREYYLQVSSIFDLLLYWVYDNIYQIAVIPANIRNKAFF